MLSSRAWYWAGAIGVAAAAVASPIVLRNYPNTWPLALVSPTSADHGAEPSPAQAAAASAPSQPAETAQSAPSVAAQPAAKSTEVASLATSAPAETAAPKAASATAAPDQKTPTPAAAPIAAARSAPAEPAPDRPAFDVVRVEPNGDTVVAGHAAARAAVELRDGGKVIAEVGADESGQFVILPPALGPGSHRLELAARGSGGVPAILSDATTIEVEALEAVAPKSAPSVAQASPAPPSPAQTPVTPSPSRAAAPTPEAVAAIASPPSVASAGAPDGAARVSVRTVEATESGRLEVKGSAEANAIVRLYLNGSFLADAVAGLDQQWSLTIEHGMSPGLYAIRADMIDRARGAVLARAEVPFTYPQHPSASVAGLAPNAPAAIASAAPAPAPSPAIAPAAAESPKPAKALEAAAPPAIAPTQEPNQPAASQPALASVSEPAPSAAPAPAIVPSTSPAPAAPSPSDVVVRDLRTTTVVRGDTLWQFGRHYYGNGMSYRQIYAANSSQIRNPNLIFPGQIFVVPKAPQP